VTASLGNAPTKLLVNNRLPTEHVGTREVVERMKRVRSRYEVFPAQAVLAGSLECFGGLLLLIGLATRLISVPLMILLTVAYLTADIDRVRAIFGDPDKFVTADEFLFLFTVVIIFVFGPGAFSLDALIGKYFERQAEKGSQRIRS